MISSRLINRIVDSSIRREKSLDSFEDSSSKTETFFFSLSKRKRKVSPNSEKIFSNSSIQITIREISSKINIANRIIDSSKRREKSLDSFVTSTFLFSLETKEKRLFTRKVSPNSEKIFSNSSIKSRFEKFRRRLILRIESSILRNEEKNR